MNITVIVKKGSFTSDETDLNLVVVDNTGAVSNLYPITITLNDTTASLPGATLQGASME